MIRKRIRPTKKQIRKAKRLRPIIPHGIEARLRRVVAGVLVPFHRQLRDILQREARNAVARRAIHRPSHVAALHQAAIREAPKNPGDSRDPHLQSVWRNAWSDGRQAAQKAQPRVENESRALASNTRKQVSQALSGQRKQKARTVDLTVRVDALATRTKDKIDAGVDDSVERANAVLEDWLEEDGEDLDALDEAAKEKLDGNLGIALALTGLAFGDLFALMSRDTQRGADVASYIWITQKDDRVRPAHRALENETCQWDDPPLSAEDSSIGEPCHPGEDVNCRCVAAPIDEEE